MISDWSNVASSQNYILNEGNFDKERKIIDIYRSNPDLFRFNPGVFLTAHAGQMDKVLWMDNRLNFIRAVGVLLAGFPFLFFWLCVKLVSSVSANPCYLGVHQAGVCLITLEGPKYSNERTLLQNKLCKAGISVSRIELNTLRYFSADSTIGISMVSKRHYWYAFRKSINILWKLIMDLPKMSPLSRTMMALSFRFAPASLSIKKAVEEFMMQIKDQKFMTLCPFNFASQLIVSGANAVNKLTYGIRTQTTTFSPEHVLINTRYLFCKNQGEAEIYKKLLDTKKTILLKAGLVARIDNSNENLKYNQGRECKYVLLFGTCSGANISSSELEVITKKAIKYAHSFGMTVCYKPHPASKNSSDYHDLLIECDLKSKVQLIDDATTLISLIKSAQLIISFQSTVLYECILQNCPIILIKHEPVISYGEFDDSPIVKRSLSESLGSQEDLVLATFNTEKVYHWFTENYFLNYCPAQYFQEQLNGKIADAFLI